LITETGITMETLKFSTNWNNKLYCDVFTTIRLHNPQKYETGRLYEIMLNGNKHSLAICIRLYTLTEEQLSDYVCLLDTGYDRKETLAIIYKMYPWITSKQKFDIVMLKKHKIRLPEQKEIEFKEQLIND
jgi:hypothetical protein